MDKETYNKEAAEAATFATMVLTLVRMGFESYENLPNDGVKMMETIDNPVFQTKYLHKFKQIRHVGMHQDVIKYRNNKEHYKNLVIDFIKTFYKNKNDWIKEILNDNFTFYIVKEDNNDLLPKKDLFIDHSSPIHEKVNSAPTSPIPEKVISVHLSSTNIDSHEETFVIQEINQNNSFNNLKVESSYFSNVKPFSITKKPKFKHFSYDSIQRRIRYRRNGHYLRFNLADSIDPINDQKEIQEFLQNYIKNLKEVTNETLVLLKNNNQIVAEHLV